MSFRTSWDDFREWLSLNHQNLANSVRAIFGVLVLLEWITLSDKQLVGIFGMFETIFQTVAAKNTVPKARVDTIVEKRVVDIMSSPAEIKQTAATAVERAEARADARN